MKKKILAAVVCAASVLSLAGCGDKKASSGSAGTSNGGGTSAASSAATSDAASEATSGDATSEHEEDLRVDTGYKLADGEDTTLTICVWNEEWKGFFNKYYKVPDGVTVNWVQTDNDSGVYQKTLDAFFKDNGGKDDKGNKIDLFLAEADYIKKYVNSDYSLDITTIGLSADVGDKYKYTVDACTSSDGKVKGASFQACPNALIYRRSIAKEVLGTDDPDEVQSKLDTWEKFSSVAATAKEKGYLMTPSALETYRVFANNATKAYMAEDGTFQLTDTFDTWLTQAEDFMKNGYTIGCGVWADEKTAEMTKDGKAMCFFGPAWYYNFCMGKAHTEAMGDWAICKGPMEAFWGGTWMLASASTDNQGLVADILKAFTENDTILSYLVEKDSQFVNKKPLMKNYAEDANYGEEFLGGQNGMKVMYEIAEGIKWDMSLHTIYDQTFNEKLPEAILEYLNGAVDKDKAFDNFYLYLEENCPTVKIPE